KALAISADQRWSTLPDVPTFREAGMPQYQEKAWLGLFAPAGTPPAIVERLNAEIVKYQRATGTRESFEAKGLVPWVTTPAQFAEALRRESTTLAPVVKSAKIEME